MIRPLILDRSRTTCEAVAAGLMANEDVETAHWACSGAEAREILGEYGPRIDVVVASHNLRDEVLRLGRSFRVDEEAPRLVVTGIPAANGAILEYLEAGVDAYLTEELSLSGLLLVLRLLQRDEVLMAPRTAHQLIQRFHSLAGLLERSGVDVSAISELTKREREVLELLGAKLTNPEIAEELFIAVGTVKSHVHAILEKLMVGSREEARRVLILARARQALDDEPPGTADRP